jgi:hypothetical protein
MTDRTHDRSPLPERSGDEPNVTPEEARTVSTDRSRVQTFDPPRLVRGGLSGRVYVVTRGKILGHDEDGRELIEASKKFDVSEQFDALVGLRTRAIEAATERLRSGELTDEEARGGALRALTESADA